jgi:predicted nicotinamide N-methyase
MSSSWRFRKAALPADCQLPFVPLPFPLPGHPEEGLFLKPSNPDTVLDSISNEQYEKDKFLPYWAELWPSTLAMLDFLTTTDFHFTRSCELGSGLGIVSSVLAHRGQTVIASDIAFDACRYARANILRSNNTARVVCADWRTMPFKQGLFDLLIASDVLYEERWIEPVLGSLEYLLSGNGAACIADPCRTWWEPFKRKAADYQFTVKQVSEKTFEKGMRIEIIMLYKRD